MILPTIPLKLTQRFFSGLLASKKCRKTSTEGMAKLTTEDAESPDEGPAVRVQLGWGYIDLNEEFPLEVGEGKALSNTFEHRLEEEEVRFPTVRTVINTDRFARCAVANIGIVPSPKGSTLTAKLVVQMVPPVRKGGQGRGFCEELVGGPGIEEFVVNTGRRRISSGFSSRHGTTKEAGKKNKGLANKAIV